MKKKIYLHLIVLFSFLIITACEDLEELQINPNEPSEVTSEGLVTGIVGDRSKSGHWDRPWWWDIHRSNQYIYSINSYYGMQDYQQGWSLYEVNAPLYQHRYDNLRNVNDLVKISRNSYENDELNPYLGFCNFWKAYFFIDMTRSVGDIPMSEAMKAEEDIYKPKYDSQKDIYINCLKLLDDANLQISKIISNDPTITIGGDLFFKGNLRKWQKVVNAYTLRILISLSKKDGDADLAIKNKFNAIISDNSKYPLFVSNEDNLQIEWLNDATNSYVLGGSSSTKYQQMYVFAGTYIELLKKYKDPRIFVVATPAPYYAVADDATLEEKLGAFKGAPTGMLLTEASTLDAEGKLSNENMDYFGKPTGEPTILIGYIEQEFNIAEAINRGWISGDAEEHYLNGINASMQHYISAGGNIEGLVDYFAQAEVVYKGDNADGLRQILEQKYLAFFINSRYEAYFNYRRTGIPDFDIGPANNNSGRIPNRWIYPESEYRLNEVNLKDALQRQFGGSDDINDVMWILK